MTVSAILIRFDSIFPPSEYLNTNLFFCKSMELVNGDSLVFLSRDETRFAARGFAAPLNI